jgi:Bacterial Ig domain
VLHGTVPITATAVDGVSGLASVSIKVNGASAGSCAVSPCTIAYDTTLLPDGPLTISVTAKDLAGNAAPATQITASSSNALPANFVISPTNGQVLTTSMKVTVKVLDSRFAKVECFVDGVSLGASTNPNFTTTVSLVNKIDGELVVTCKAQDSSGNVGTQTATPTVKNWLERVRPQAFNLKSKGIYVRMVVRNTDRQVLNASNLIPISGKNLTLQIPGVSPVPVIVSTPTGTKDDDSDGDGEDDPDDKDYRRVVLKVSRPTFVASVKAGIAVGSIDPKKPLSVKLYSGTHYIGSDTMDVKQ